MEIQVSVHDWLALPMLTRVKLREIFSIPKSTGSLVEGNVVKSDGTTFTDLKAITVEKMQAYLDHTEVDDFVKLFNGCVDKIAEADKELEPLEKVDPTQIILEEWATNIARMQNQAAGLSLKDEFQVLISKFISNEYARPNAVPASKPKGRPAGKKAK